jgi:3-oxoacyl-(acyl-carrier-protein) synthase
MLSKRIVVTGMGVVTPIGDTPDKFYKNLLSGKSAIDIVRSQDMSKVEAKIGGDLGDYDFKSRLEQIRTLIPEKKFRQIRKIIKSAPFSTKLTIISALNATIDAGIVNTAQDDPDNVAIVVGGHNMNGDYISRNVHQFDEEPEYIDPLFCVHVYDTDMAASIAESLQVTGPMYTTGGACASAGIALRHGINEIVTGDCHTALVGGGNLAYSAIGYQGLVMIDAISYRTYNNEPQRASRPFDTKREGFVPSHGSAFLVIEELEHALERGADIYAEIGGVAVGNDANHLANPSISGQVKTMKKAISIAGLKPEDIGYVNAHATSTPLGDKTEIESIQTLFAYNSHLKVNATKSMTGHTGWTSHIVELIATIMQMNNSRLHPSINIEELDPAITVDVCSGSACEHTFDFALKNSFGFGGINCSTVIKKYR